MKLRIITVRTPCGPFSVALTATGALAATAFGERAALQSRLPQGCHLIDDKPTDAPVRQQVEEYFEGGRRRFELELAPTGTPFQQSVWQALIHIPFGATRSYGELAQRLKSGARAVGRANATNPICLIVPCHRVIGADGSLTGFAFGHDIKRRLLEHEGARSAAAGTRAA